MTTESDAQGLSKKMVDLQDDVLADEYWYSLLAEMIETLGTFDRGIVDELNLKVPGSIKLRSIVRYCIPFFELQRAIDGKEPDPEWLAAMYLWQEVWRPFDNLLDNDGPIVDNLREYNIYLLRAWSFHSHLFPDSQLMERLLHCLNDTLNIEVNYEESTNPSLIHQRVRLYEVVIDSIPQLSMEARTSFRAYINTIGVAHDFGDVTDDIKSGKVTFATATLRGIDSHCRLTSSHYNQLERACKVAFHGELTKLSMGALNSCWVTARNVEAFFSWAFCK